MQFHAKNYGDLFNKKINLRNIKTLKIYDHLGGFSKDYKNSILDFLSSCCYKGKIATSYVLPNEVYKQYNTLNLTTNIATIPTCFNVFELYTIHPEIKFKNFLCSFNGSNHVSRQLLVAIINKFGLFDKNFSSKNFSYSQDQIDGHILNFDLSNTQIQLYQRFFRNSIDFNNLINSFSHVRYNHSKNIFNLEYQLTKSFIHVVSETMSTSYCPFVTEKFLYSVVTRGLYIANAQPRWHKHLQDIYGFKLYENIFDYSFDKEPNFIKRLITLFDMISKFAHLTPLDWHDLYLMESETIEYNYDHYFSKSYLTHIQRNVSKK